MEAGPLHRWRPEVLAFRNEGFVERFAQQGEYVATDHRVSWTDRDGVRRQASIGDDRPLVLGGYRVYAAPNRGFSPIFLWVGRDGWPVRGSVQLPVPGFALGMIQPLTAGQTVVQPFTAAQAWSLPDGTEAWVMLEPDDAAQPVGGAGRENLGAASLAHGLVLRVGDRRWQLRPGDEVELPGGRLTYERLDAWMGYRIVRDSMMEWLFAVCMAAVFSLGWFYVRRFRASSWLKDEVEECRQTG